MTFTPTYLEGNYLVQPNTLGDDRGWFMRTFCKGEFASIGHTKEWLQMNHSFTGQKGTVRGLHFQDPPFAEIKLVRCIRGAVWDVAVDLRPKSATYLKWFAAELNSSNKLMMYIPEGFAHGFQTLEENSELIYLHSQNYTPGSEGGIRFNDGVLNIEWPGVVTQVSERDLNLPQINDQFKSNF